MVKGIRFDPGISSLKDFKYISNYINYKGSFSRFLLQKSSNTSLITLSILLFSLLLLGIVITNIGIGIASAVGITGISASLDLT